MNTTIIPLSQLQVNLLNLLLKEFSYVGKATTLDNKPIKLFLFDGNGLLPPYEDFKDMIPQSEYNALQSLDGSYIFSPYYRTLTRDLKHLVDSKKLVLQFKRILYEDIPSSLLTPDFHIENLNKDAFVADLNNGQHYMRCKQCGGIVHCTDVNAYYEYYSCLNPLCNFTTKVC